MNEPRLSGTPPTGTVTVPYGFVFDVLGGTEPFLFSVQRGMMPPGLTLDALLGAITGEPTIRGVFHFRVQITDQVFNVGRLDCKIRIV